ncbi:MAG: diguanylate cyclase [Gammaproteobacteria bacterium]|nr:diguanylate cyclase [Gammaproteobacteria bacterium]
MINSPTAEYLEFIVNRVNVGLFILDENMNVVFWNHFMELNSKVPRKQILDKNLFESFPELPKKWFEKKIKSVFFLRGFSFVSWEQRPWLFEFPHNRPITGGVEFMYQDLVLMPIKNIEGEVKKVCVALHDVTDVGYYQTKLQTTMKELSLASRIDGLTGLFNRSHWEERLSEEFSRIKRYGGKLSLVMFDLDKFKLVNDTHGHLAGDAILKVVSENVLNVIRESDIAGRYGGEEFAVILPNTDIEGAKVVVEKLRKLSEETVVDFGGEKLKFTISGGVSEMESTLENHELLISQADEALYYSKAHGRNCFHVYPLSAS